MANDFGEEIRAARGLAREIAGMSDRASELATDLVGHLTTTVEGVSPVDRWQLIIRLALEAASADGIEISGYTHCCGCSSAVIGLVGPGGERDVEVGHHGV